MASKKFDIKVCRSAFEAVELEHTKAAWVALGSEREGFKNTEKQKMSKNMGSW